MYMKNKLVLLLFFILTGAVSVNAQNLPDQKETLEVMKKVNGYFMKSMPIILSPVFMVVYVPVISGHVAYIMRG